MNRDVIIKIVWPCDLFLTYQICPFCFSASKTEMLRIKTRFLKVSGRSELCFRGKLTSEVCDIFVFVFSNFWVGPNSPEHPANFCKPSEWRSKALGQFLSEFELSVHLTIRRLLLKIACINTSSKMRIVPGWIAKIIFRYFWKLSLFFDGRFWTQKLR